MLVVSLGCDACVAMYRVRIYWVRCVGCELREKLCGMLGVRCAVWVAMCWMRRVGYDVCVVRCEACDALHAMCGIRCV